MKTLLTFIFFLFLLACGEQTVSVQKTSAIISDEDLTILKHMKEVEWPKAYRTQDTVLLDAILGDDFQMIDASGNWSNKSEELDWISKNPVQNDSFYFEIERLDVLDNGTALICGTGHIFNDSVETLYESSNVLIKRNGAWKAVASHVSGIRASE